MSPASLNEALRIALEHHRAGRLAEAEASYRQILGVRPDHVEAWHFLGVIAHQRGRHDIAVELIGRAIALDPQNAAAHCNLGEAYRALGRLEEAVVSLRRAVELDPGSPVAHNNLGIALAEQRRLSEAIASYRTAILLQPAFPEAHNNLGLALLEERALAESVACFHRAIEFRPSYHEAHNNLGMALIGQGQVDEAIAAYRRAIDFRPEYPKACYNLGLALSGQGRFDEAIAAYGRAIELKGDDADAWNNLGIALAWLGRLDEAMAAYRRALELRPGAADFLNNLGSVLLDQNQSAAAEAAYRQAAAGRPGSEVIHNNLGNALRKQARFGEAADAYRRALELKADFPEGYHNLANVLKDQGNLDEALAVYRRAIALRPEDPGLRSNLIYSLYFWPGLEEATIADAQREWNAQVRKSWKGDIIGRHRNERNPERRPLRIGYVSPHFRDHVVGRNMLPLFRHHHRQEVEIFCYSGVIKPDGLTEQIRHEASEWRNTVGVTDEALAEVIRRDEVDILADLSQHLEGHRLPVLARRPAPVQVSFAGYPESAGVEGIGYRIGDRYLDATDTGGIEDGRSGTGDRRSVPRARVTPELRSPSGELRPGECVYLIDSFWCYDPCGVDVAVHELPGAATGNITFGSLNNFCKINDLVLQLWARVLTQVRNSRLLLSSGLGSHRQRTIDFLAQHGVEPTRVEFVTPCPRKDYLELYHRLDIALDPFPYGGHTTSLDALWMGVPMVSLAGERPVSRAGLSILNNLGLPELVTFSEDEYVKIAVSLANDLPRLAELRQTLRPRMENSVLMDAPHFAHQIEAAYRAMWRDWCARQESL
jgi:predicted O-linked N-acetylglucosamine transferase (SPINDLY family)